MGSIPRPSRIVPLVALLVGLGACAPSTPPGAVYVVDRPPPVRHDRRPPPPGPGLAWIGGHYRWDGQYVWVPGHWERVPRSRHTWAAGHWQQTRRGWIWIEGHWR